MKEIILDLRDVEYIAGETWADSVARSELENAVLDFAGRVIRLKITVIKRYGYRDENGRLH